MGVKAESRQTHKGESIHLHGVPASPGIYIGAAVAHAAILPPEAPRTVPAGQIETQIRLLDRALRSAEREIAELRDRLRDSLDEAHAAIFDPHLLFVQDATLRERVVDRMRQRGESAAYAVMAVVQELAGQFAQIGDAYISSRGTDVYDVGNRICKHLAPSRRDARRAPMYSRDAIVLAHDLSPSDTAQMDRRHVKAFATEIGGPTSHTAILAKALEIPAVVGLGSLMRHLRPGMTAIVDGHEGTVVLNPTPTEVNQARNRRRRHLQRERDFRKLRALPAETIDGYQVELSANLEFMSELPHVLEHGARGIGLFRTEFLYLEKAGLPTEEEQFEVYRQVAETVAPEAVIFRTLDVGGDKFPGDVGSREELNPFLGLRAIRFCLSKPEIFRTQLRALLRASAFGRVRIMFPMISSIGELVRAKKELQIAKRELAAQEIAFDREIEIGVMIEIPSAALAASRLAREVDFFSIGTNDLLQYTLAVDRSNEKVADLYDPYHPAILELLRVAIDAAHRAGIWVGVCGEMASNPRTALLLVGLGVDELSMSPAAAPETKFLIRQIKLSEAQKLANRVYGLESSEEIRQAVESSYQELCKRRIQPALETVGA